jgi:dUTP pyrophosphatase
MEFIRDYPVTLIDVINKLRKETHNDRIMVLNLFVDSKTETLKKCYLSAAQKHNNSLIEEPHFFNSGFDLFLPEAYQFSKSNGVNKVSFGVKCSAKIYCIGQGQRQESEDSYSNNYNNYYTGYYIYPRSSISKTPLRLANSTGIIDAGYRGPLIGMFDCLVDNYDAEIHTRLLQICAPNLMPIFVNIINTTQELGPETSRGEGGFGSTGI